MNQVAYYNTELINHQDLAIDIRDLGFIMGTTVSERLRTFAGDLFELDTHLQRLQDSLDITKLSPPQSLQEIKKAAISLVANNHALLRSGSDLALTILITPGISNRDECTMIMYTDELPFSQLKHWYRKGAALQVSDHRQVPANCWPSKLKCRSRMHYYLADQQAKEKQSDARALLLDQNGNVAEASTANVLIYERSSGLISPKPDVILPGISLSVVEKLATEIRVDFSYENISVDRLLNADEAMLCSTSPCLWPVTQCNGIEVGAHSHETVTARLQQAWSNHVGLDLVAQAEVLG
ncbi:MAG: aminotransferase class IV [Planctomycetota bacterium]|nr:aminotransferase class IV [Planctomycetota bacterium]